MAGNLRSRLKQIKKLGKGAAGSSGHQGASPPMQPGLPSPWSPAGDFAAVRTELIPLDLDFPEKLPQALSCLAPDFAVPMYAWGEVRPEDLLFFDLETTGLSTGPGVVAFLAAFGNFQDAQDFAFRQYLLLDYPGESEFLDAILKEFGPEKKIIVTYNGKTFDSQILKTRCLMQGLRPPDYFHADLLHPSRRLWSHALRRCGQAEIETEILKISREGDTSGSEAPDIWFDFLKTGRTDLLLAVCEHNIRDILGLAAILHALVSLSADPLQHLDRLHANPEALALRFKDRQGISWEKILDTAACRGFPRAMFVKARQLEKGGNFIEAAGYYTRIAAGDFRPNLRAKSLRRLSLNAERRDPASALAYTCEALAIDGLSPALREALERRRLRLERRKQPKKAC